MRSLWAVFAIVVVASAPSHAQPSDSVAAAEQLFAQARSELEQGNTLKACELFEASLKLDAQRGTLLNLADCYERAKLVASAWGRFKELEVLSSKAGDEQRASIARERIAALEPRLPKLAIAVPAPVPGLSVVRNKVKLDEATYGTAIFVDPGEHVIEASAPGYRPFSTTTTIDEAQQKDVTIPALEPIPKPKDPPPKPSTIIVRQDPGKTRRIVGLVFAGGGIVSLSAGIGFGVSARSTYQSAFDDGLCMEATKLCNVEGQARTDRARDRATFANIFSGVGVGLAVTGAILYFTAPKARDVAVTPTAGGAAVTFGGTW